MSDPRYDKISELFIEYSNGNFDYKIDISDKFDEIDAFISSINMLGEELKDITISKEFFNNVFDSVSDLIFVLDLNGKIKMVNKAVNFKVGFSENELKGVHIDILFENGHRSFFKKAMERTFLNSSKNNFDTTFYFAKKSYSSLCTFNKLNSEADEHIGYTLIVKDLSSIKKAEELVRISEEKYRKLFDESGNGIIITNKMGEMLEMNLAASKLLGVKILKNKKNDFYKFLLDENEVVKIKRFFSSAKKENNFKLSIRNLETNFVTSCLITISKLSGWNQFQIVLKDMTNENEVENLLIRTIVDTQEKERIRFSRDIHDSLGQQLSAIKFYLSTLSNSKQLNEKNQILIDKSENGVNSILTNLREICFNLMPKTIENFGLLAAVNELSKNFKNVSELNFNISAEDHFPRLSFDKEIAIFRIIQEFINNSIKHAKANNIDIIFRFNNSDVLITLLDDGIGFDKEMDNFVSGMGLKNVYSRARSYNGDLKIYSSIGHGTKYELNLPINKN